MVYLLEHIRVADYDAFTAVFNDDAERRRFSGSQGGRLFRSMDNPNEVVALFEWAGVEEARRFAGSYELSEAAEWATVVGSQRTVTVLEELRDVEA